MLARALAGATPAEEAELRGALGAETLTDAEVASLREIFERTGALSYVEHLVQDLSDQAFGALDSLELDTEPASMLRALGYAAVERRA